MKGRAKAETLEPEREGGRHEIENGAQEAGADSESGGNGQRVLSGSLERRLCAPSAPDPLATSHESETVCEDATAAADMGERVVRHGDLAKPEPVENSAPSDAAPVSRKSAHQILHLVPNVGAEVVHQDAAPVRAPVVKPVTPLPATAPKLRTIVHQGSAPSGKVLPCEWRTEWKTTSADVRALWKRLHVFKAGKWCRATKKDRDEGLVPDVVLNQEVRAFTIATAQKIEKLGDRNVRRAIELNLNRGRATGLRRTA